MIPRARQEGLVVQEVGDETIIYDEQRNHVHRLNQSAALVWHHCDGQRTVADLAVVLQDAVPVSMTEDMVWLALDRLEKGHLLQDPLVRSEEIGRVTRRQMLRKAAFVGGAALLIPVVQSIIAPTPAMAMSFGCARKGQTYDYAAGRPCCPGLIAGPRGQCLDRAGQN